jgi:glycosyltransferase involved in cell wall biosynthesis
MSALRSPHVNEVVLVDDGSSDGSPKVLAELAAENPTRVRDLTNGDGRNRGAHNRLNELVEAARCPWVAVLNSDDVFVDGRFEAIVADKRFPESDFVFGNLLLVDAGGKLISAKRGPTNPGNSFPGEFDVGEMVKSGNLVDLMAHQNCIGTTSNMIFTKKLHARIGGFAAFRYVHDWDFALRAMALGCCSYIRRYLTVYRMHASNTINESSAQVNVESRILFDRLLTDFPQLAERRYFRIGLRNNVYLISSLLANSAIRDGLVPYPRERSAGPGRFDECGAPGEVQALSHCTSVDLSLRFSRTRFSHGHQLRPLWFVLGSRILLAQRCLYEPCRLRLQFVSRDRVSG